MDGHRPYYPPDEFISKIHDSFIPDSEKRLINEVVKFFKPYSQKKYVIKKNKHIDLTGILYNAELNYIDQYVGVLFKYLKKIKIFKDTNIILTADHGEAIFEHNLLGHQVCLYDELLKIPLIIKLMDGYVRKKEIESQTELIDIAPTILDIFDIPKHKSFKGVSLLSLINKNIYEKSNKFVFSALLHHNNFVYTVVHERDLDFYPLISVRNPMWKLIYDDQTKIYELYNLMKDPYESINLYNEQRENIVLIRSYLTNLLLKKLDNYFSEEQKIKRIIDKKLSLKI